MKKTSERLLKKVSQDFLPIAERLRSEGVSDANIMITLNRHIDRERHKLYNLKKEPEAIKGAIKRVMDQENDSKIEHIYYQLFEKNGIPFKFQYKIGPYRADFLIAGDIVFEIDGPWHNKDYDKVRDEYMESRGYSIMRIPFNIAASYHRTVLEDLQEVLSERE